MTTFCPPTLVPINVAFDLRPAKLRRSICSPIHPRDRTSGISRFVRVGPQEGSSEQFSTAPSRARVDCGEVVRPMGIEPTLWKQHFECRDAWRRGKPAIEGELDGWRITLKPPLF
jgi:hypothetical protein